MIRLLGQLLGWGVYVLPIGLIVFGLWLILRKIERIPPLSLERAVGSGLLFLWLLTVMHAIVAAPEAALAAAARWRRRWLHRQPVRAPAVVWPGRLGRHCCSDRLVADRPHHDPGCDAAGYVCAGWAPLRRGLRSI